MKFKDFYSYLHEQKNSNLHNAVIDFIDNEYSGSGMGGDCGNFAIELNRKLGGVGEYMGATNIHVTKTQGYFWIGHVALSVFGELYDIDGNIEDVEAFKSWGQIDEDTGEDIGISTTECYDSSIINMTKTFGGDVEKVITKVLSKSNRI